MKFRYLLFSSALLLTGPLFADVGGSDANNNQTSTQTSGGTVDSKDGIYTVTVAPTGTTVAALKGTVTLTKADGTVMTIDIGTGMVIAADGTTTTESLASIVAAEKAAGNTTGASSVTAALGQALQTVADNTKAGAYGNGGVTLLASLVKVMSAANPDSMADYVGTAVSAVTSSGSGATDKSAAAMAIAQAATSTIPGRANGVATTAAIKAANANGVKVTAMDARLVGEVNDYTATGKDTPITPVDPTTITVSPSSN